MGILYCVIVYVGFSPSPILVSFLFSVQSLFYNPIYLIFRPSSLTTNFPVWYYMRGVQMGGGGLHGWHGGVLGFTRELMLAHNLMCQPDSQIRVPVRIPVPQGTG